MRENNELFCLVLKENGKISLEIPLARIEIDGAGSIDDFDFIRIATEKATPQAPRSFKGAATGDYTVAVNYYCPKCDHLVGSDLRPIGINKFDRNLYCSDCGQEIDWSDENI